MPEGILLGEEAKEVAAFVAAYAGQIGKGPTVDTETAPKPDPPACDARRAERPNAASCSQRPRHAEAAWRSAAHLLASRLRFLRS